MDERKSTIRLLEEKNKSDTEERNRLLEGLGETLLTGTGEGELPLFNSGDRPGAVLVEYRRLQKEIAEAMVSIKSTEAAIKRLKELEEAISGVEEDCSRLEKKLGEVHIELGKALLLNLDSDNFTGSSRRQEEVLLARIDEYEKKLEQLEQKEGSVFTWLGKNAQMALSRALLLKNRSALQRVYRNAGEKFLPAGSETAAETRHDPDPASGSSPSLDDLDGDTARIAGEALELRNFLSSRTEGLAELKGERKKIVELFGAGASPSRSIQGLEKQIASVKAKFPGVYLQFGSLAAEGKGAISSLIRDEDRPVLEKAEFIRARTAERELEIERLNAAIGIDDEKAEIEKTKKAISGQRQKIAAAEKAIADLEKEITASEQHIVELNAFLNSTDNSVDTSARQELQDKKEDHGRENKENGKTEKKPGSAGGKTGHSGKGHSRESGTGFGARPGRKKSGS